MKTSSSFRRFLTTLRLLVSDKSGNGEIVAVLVAVGIAVTLGLVAVTKIGTSAGTNSTKLGGKIEAIGG